MSIDPALLATYQSAAPTLCFVVTMTRRDEQVFRWAALDRDVTIDGNTYSAQPGVDVSAIQSTAGFAVDNGEVTVLADDDITRADILAGVWNGCALELAEVDYAAATPVKNVLKKGRLGNFKPKRGAFVAEFRGLLQPIQQSRETVLQPNCRYTFGVRNAVSHCPIVLADHEVNGSVTSSISPYQVIDSSRTEASDWFGEGMFTFTGGENANSPPRKIKSYVNGEFTFWEQWVYPIAPGDTYTATPGCRLRFEEDCRDKWHVQIDFGGEPRHRSLDSLTAREPIASFGPSPAPAPAPAPAPSLPTPGAFNAAARVVGLDYTQTYDAGNVSDLSRYGLVIRGFNTYHATNDGATYGAGLLAANPNTALAHYSIVNELKDPVTSGEDIYTAWQEVNARNWWVRNPVSKVQWTTAYGAYEVNITTATTANGSGQRYPQFRAAWEFTNRLNSIPDATWVFCDNVFSQSRVTADYDIDGSNEAPSASASAFRAGEAAFSAALKTHRVGLKTIANADNDLSSAEYSGVFNAAWNEGCVGRSYGTFATGGITAVRERCLAHIAHTADGMAILNSYGESTDYVTHRFAKCMAMLFDAWHAAVDTTPQLHAVWLDENGQDVGVATDAVPSAAWSNSVWARRFENGLVLVNPTTGSKTVDPTTLGTYTRFTGTQDSTLNNGAAVTGSITLAAQSGLLLVTP